MNMRHIQEVLGRSLATIHRVSSLYVHETVDNRGQKHSEYISRQNVFSRQKSILQIRLKLWFSGLADSLQEALEMPMVPLALISSENSCEDKGEEPP